MTTVIESATSSTRDGLDSCLSTPLIAEQVGENRQTNATNDADYELRDYRQHMRPSRHTHNDPLQATIEDELDSWARHAMASNGFGDLL